MRSARPPALPFLALGLLLAASCGGETHDEEPASPASFEAPVPAEEDAAPRRVVRPAASVRPAEAFPHGAHVEIRCGQCHASVRGHASHGRVACAECHEGSELGVRQDLTRADCLSCHHGAQQERRCLDCHEAVTDRAVTRSIDMSVWPAARTRVLPFSHDRHANADCVTCHRQAPSLAPDRACATCHERHHDAEADCASCHQEAPAGAHPVEVHLGCGGAGCHDDPVVEALPQSRQVCLVCHQAQRNHEPGRDCAPCHSVGQIEDLTPWVEATHWEGAGR